jgi:hypothetical protein
METEYLVKQINLKDGNVLEIYQDTDAQNPRDTSYDEGNVAIIAAFAKNYGLCDKAVPFGSADFGSFDEMEMHIKKELRAIVCLPLYMYSHSGITISTTPFSCKWDSGQIGFVYTTAKRLSELGVNIKNDEDIVMYKERVKQMLLSEVNVFDQYLTGEVYSFSLKTKDGEELDSCHGFYGTDFKTNGILDHIDSEPINLDDL